jgi:hypothetical protein
VKRGGGVNLNGDGFLHGAPARWAEALRE